MAAQVHSVLARHEPEQDNPVIARMAYHCRRREARHGLYGRHARAVALAALLLASGCTSAPALIGPGLYAVSDDGGWGNASSMVPGLYRRAQEHCAGQGLEAQPEGINQQDARIASFAGAEMRFRCVPAGSAK